MANSKLDNLNNKIATRITRSVGTMWCAYAFAGLAMISLPNAISHGVSGTIPWIAQTFLQLVLLSIIMVGQEAQAQKTEARDEEDHQAILEEFQEIKDIHGELLLLSKQIKNSIKYSEKEKDC